MINLSNYQRTQYIFAPKGQKCGLRNVGWGFLTSTFDILCLKYSTVIYSQFSHMARYQNSLSDLTILEFTFPILDGIA